MVNNIPAIGGLENLDNVRVVLFQSGRLVHVSLKEIAYALNEQTGGQARMKASTVRFNLIGRAVNFKRQNIGFVAETGAFSLSGKAVNLLSGKGIKVAAGAFSLTGKSVLYQRTTAMRGTYFLLNGKDADFKRSFSLGTGAFTLTGND